MDSKLVVIIIGLPGSGKSFLSHLISEQNSDFIWMNTDKYRKSMKLDEKDSNYALTKTIYSRMLGDAVDSLKKEQNIILDATFYKRELRELAYNLVKQYTDKIAMFFLSADLKTTKERIETRQKKHTGVSDINVFFKIKELFEPIDLDEENKYSCIAYIDSSNNKQLIKNITLNSKPNPFTKVISSLNV